MIRKAINELANFIEQHKELRFDMESCSVATCGTAGCIAGFAVALWPELNCHGGWRHDEVSEKLGLNCSHADELFYPLSLDYITRKGAVRTLRRLARTGDITFYESQGTA